MEATIQKPVTLEDIFAIFDRQRIKDEERWTKDEERWAEDQARWAKDEERKAEDKERWAKWDEQLAKDKARAERIAAETEKLAAENKMRAAENDRQYKRLKKQLGGIGNTLGEISEEMVKNGITEIFNSCGYHFTDRARHYELTVNDKIKTEADIILFDGDYVAIIEVKSKVDKEDVAHHLKRLEIFKKYETGKCWDTKKIIGAVGGLVIEDEVAQSALESGLFVIKQSGKNLQIEAPEQRLVLERQISEK